MKQSAPDRIIALDFETSGRTPNLDWEYADITPSKHAPVSLGVALMEGEKVLDSREWLFAPPRHYKTGRIERTYDVAALEISNYTWPQIKREGMAHADVVRDLDQWVTERAANRATVVAWNSPFDDGFYSDMLFLAGEFVPAFKARIAAASPLAGPWQCAMRLARRNLTLADYKLDTVAAHFHLSRETEVHCAREDAILAGRIFHRLATAKAVAA